MLAAEYGHENVVLELLRHKDVNDKRHVNLGERGDGCMSALRLACKHGHEELVSALLAASANVNIEQMGASFGSRSALMTAAKYGTQARTRTHAPTHAHERTHAHTRPGLTWLGWR